MRPVGEGVWPRWRYGSHQAYPQLAGRRVTLDGTAAYRGYAHLPEQVVRAVATAERLGFESSCLPQQGELLRVLAAGVGAGVIGETGTGCGVGLAWLASGAHRGARLVGVERDTQRAAAAAAVFANDVRITVRTGDWRELAADGTFDLLVLDGGGQGKGDDPPLDPGDWLRVGGLLVMDDFTPMRTWPPTHDGRLDAVRLHWLRHPALRAAEVRVAPSAATIVATYVGGPRNSAHGS
jgi:predicted O-methyltransferase YrrM